MKKKVLILMAEKTGSGHKSSSEALKNSILEKTDNIEVIIYNAMNLIKGKIGIRMENGYGNLTTKTPLIWKLVYESTNIISGFTNHLLYLTLKKKFTKLVEEIKPDIIISLHPMFNGSVAKTLKKCKLNIPFFVYIIDIVKVSRMWHSKKADMTFCPTGKIYDKLVKLGFEKERLLTAGFPINKKFAKSNSLNEKEYIIPKVLMVLPSTKSKKTLKFALTLIDNFNVDLTLITGKNEKVYSFIQRKLADKKVNILKFIDNMPAELSKSDILLTKSGPNMMLEAVRTGVPVIVTGHILGQEEKNYKLITDNGYGLKCESVKKLKKVFSGFEKDNYKTLNSFKQNEINSGLTDGADTAAEYIINFLKNG